MKYLLEVVFPIVLIIADLIFGNVIPVSVETYPKQWKPVPVQSYSAYQPLNGNYNVKLKYYNGTRTFYSDQNRQPSRGVSTQTPQRVPDLPFPDPKPRREDIFEEKLGFGMLSSLLPTSVLSSPQRKPEDEENQIETDNSGSNSYQNNPPLQQDPVPYQFHQPQSNKGVGSSSPFSSGQSFPIANEETSQEADSDSGLFSKIRNLLQSNEDSRPSLPFSSQQFVPNSNSESSQEENSNSALFSRIRNLLQNNRDTGALSFSSSEPFMPNPESNPEANSNAGGLFSNIRNLLQNNEGSGSSSPFSSEQSFLNEETSQESTSDSGGLFSNIRNLFPFGKGLMSGLLNNDNSDNEGTANENYNNENAGGIGETDSYNLLPTNNFSPVQGHRNSTSLFSFLPGQAGLPNFSSSGDSDTSSSESTVSGSSFLSSLPNPLTGLRNLFSNIIPSSGENELQPELGGGYVDNPIATTDSSLTPWQSLADGGFSGAFGAIVPYLSHVVTALGVAKAKLPAIKLIGAVLGPILATAIAAMVIGIVYVSFYVAAVSIQNAGIEGEMYLLPFTQLLDLLGLPDPLEELFGFGRSFQGRSLNSNLKEIDDAHGTSVAPRNTTYQNNECMERLACHAIGRKLVGSKPSWKDGWLGKGIRWISTNVNLDDWDIARNATNYYINYVRNGKLLIDAISIGIESDSQQLQHSNKTQSTISICAKYACSDPVKFLYKAFKP